MGSNPTPSARTSIVRPGDTRPRSFERLNKALGLAKASPNLQGLAEQVWTDLAVLDGRQLRQVPEGKSEPTIGTLIYNSGWPSSQAMTLEREPLSIG